MAYAPDLYDSPPSPDADPREIEAWALLKSARQLSDACRNPGDTEKLRECLRQNQLLWTIFQTSVAEEGCPLPQDLRESVLRLSLFVDGRTFKCLGDLDVTKIQALIDLNRNVALGLKSKVEIANELDQKSSSAGSIAKPIGTKLDC